MKRPPPEDEGQRDREGQVLGPERSAQDSGDDEHHQDDRRPVALGDAGQLGEQDGGDHDSAQHPYAWHGPALHPAPTRGSRPRRASRRSTSSRVRGPFHGTTGQPAAESWASR